MIKKLHSNFLRYKSAFADGERTAMSLIFRIFDKDDARKKSKLTELLKKLRFKLWEEGANPVDLIIVHRSSDTKEGREQKQEHSGALLVKYTVWAPEAVTLV